MKCVEWRWSGLWLFYLSWRRSNAPCVTVQCLNNWSEEGFWNWTDEIDVEKCKNNRLEKNLRMLLATSLILAFLLLSCVISDREKHHCTVSRAMLLWKEKTYVF